MVSNEVGSTDAKYQLPKSRNAASQSAIPTDKIPKTWDVLLTPTANHMSRLINTVGLLAIAALLTLIAACDTINSDVLSESESLDAAGIDGSGMSAYKARKSLNGEVRSLLATQAPYRGLSFYRLPDSDELHKIPQDPKNPLTDAKVRLGQLLYHETALAVNNRYKDGRETYSCASCHFAQAGFQANLPQGIAEGGLGFGAAGEGRVANPLYDSHSDEHIPDIQPIRSPTTMNSAYQELMLWNGQFGAVGENRGTEASWTGPKESNFLGFHGLETQAHAGLGVHRMEGIDISRVAEISEYGALFVKAFPSSSEPVNRLNAALAIAAYERILLATEAPFQRWLRGEIRAMNEQELRGAMLFFGKAQCSSCHTGPALNSMTFHALGMNDLDGAADPRINLDPFAGTVPDDVRRGRGGFTGDADDDFKFKTPQLYNLKDSPFYGHGASFTSIRAVIEYKNDGVAENPLVPASGLSGYFVPLGLSESEVGDLAAFVGDALYDPYLLRYVPGHLPSGNCTPVNDEIARGDLGCR